jgi:DNA-binding winged helix-turn-helix (wHTH) protein/tetratricopeptide (TPR) repeat protein
MVARRGLVVLSLAPILPEGFLKIDAQLPDRALTDTPRTFPDPGADSRFMLGRWRVDPRLDRIEADGRSVKLEPRSMRLLVALADARGELVTTDQLLDRVWPGLVVTPSSIYEAVAQLRRSLGTDAEGRHAVATVPRKGYRLAWSTHPPAPGPSLGDKSIAVLPLRLRRVPEELAFIGHRLTAELIAELSRQPEWWVVAHGTMLSFAAQELPAGDIGRQLGARFVVEGVAERNGEALAITLQVVDTVDSTQSGTDSIVVPFASWESAARTVVARLSRGLKFDVLQRLSLRSPRADSPKAQAYTLAARAWVELFSRPESAATNERALAWAMQGLCVDPTLALAHVCLATCHWRAAQFGWQDGDPRTALDTAARHAETAVASDLQDPDAHYIHSLVAYSHGETVRAEEALRHCLVLNASFAPAYGLLALVRTRRGHPEEAAGWCARAFAISPREPLRAVWHLATAWAALSLGDFRGALDAAQRGMAVNPDFATCYLAGAAAAQALGVDELTRSWLRRLQDRTVFNSLEAVQRRMPPATEPAHRRQMDELLALLRQAGLR